MRCYRRCYGADPEPQKRYSPAKCIGIKVEAIQGNPNPERIRTFYVERQNLTMRMSMRRFTRLTNAFSKKVENLARAVALHFMYYNYCRIHRSLRATPAMAAGSRPGFAALRTLFSFSKPGRNQTDPVVLAGGGNKGGDALVVDGRLFTVSKSGVRASQLGDLQNIAWVPFAR